MVPTLYFPQAILYGEKVLGYLTPSPKSDMLLYAVKINHYFSLVYALANELICSLSTFACLSLVN